MKRFKLCTSQEEYLKAQKLLFLAGYGWSTYNSEPTEVRPIRADFNGGVCIIWNDHRKRLTYSSGGPITSREYCLGNRYVESSLPLVNPLGYKIKSEEIIL